MMEIVAVLTTGLSARRTAASSLGIGFGFPVVIGTPVYATPVY